MTYVVRNPGPGLGHAQKCGGVKPVILLNIFEYNDACHFIFQCPPVAVAIAKAKKDGKSFANKSSVEFPVVDISDCMGWDSGPVKRELKMLMWNLNGN